MSRTLRAVAAGLLVLAVGVTTAGSVTAQPAGPLPVLSGHVRLMIAGDSTAAGVPVSCSDGSPFGERAVLGTWLTGAGGLDVEFVGSVNAACAAPYGHSEGRGGETIFHLADTIAGYLTATPADVLILRVGVNDAKASGGFRTAAQMAADYARLIDNARSAWPGIRILASEVIPPDGMVMPAGAPPREFARASVTARKFNALLPGIVAPYGDAVHVGGFGRITPVWLADGLHPSGQGYVGIAWILIQQPDGIWPWLSADPPPALRPWDVVLDPWR